MYTNSRTKSHKYTCLTGVKFLSNCIRGPKQFTVCNNTKSKQATIKTEVLQGGVLSPTLFNIYKSDIPTKPNNRIKLITYADDVTIFSTHTNINTVKQQVHSYLQHIFSWTKQNILILNPSKTQTMLFPPHPAEHSIKPRLTINNTTLPPDKNIKNTRSNIRPRHTFAKQTKHDRQSEDHNKNTKSAHHYALEELQGNTAKHIHCHHQNDTRILKHYLITNYNTQQTTNRAKYSVSYHHMMNTRPKHTSA